MTDAAAVFVLGTRPEIIKLAPVIEECETLGVPFAVVHTGQHYSKSLDAVFFEQLDVPWPDVNLGVGSAPHGEQTGAMLVGLDPVLREIDPEVVFVQGDTNSALAGAVVGSKLDVEVAHVEAGLRSFDRAMPEEVNRVLIDHVADRLYAPTRETATLLRREGIPDDRIVVTGNTVVDAIRRFEVVARNASGVLDELALEPGRFFLLTAHRQENVDDPETFADILAGVARFADRHETDIVYPIHPRARGRIDEFDLPVPGRIRVVEPLSFLDFLHLESAAALVVTDSGGVQEEACVLGTPCVTVRYGTERPETVHVGANCVAGTGSDDIVAAAERMLGKPGDWASPFGDGDAARRIMADLALADRRERATP